MIRPLYRLRRRAKLRKVSNMIHYHGTPITPEHAAARILSGRHAFISFAYPEQLPLVSTICQSFALDNGAFSAWRSGTPRNSWNAYYEWVDQARRLPGFDWAVIPDVIEGTEEENAALVEEWPFARHEGVPVWHLHESLERLDHLVSVWPCVALGGSGDYNQPGSSVWWDRITEAMGVLCEEDGCPRTRMHGLRMLNPAIFTQLPLSSADSTHIARTVSLDTKWKGTYVPKNPSVRGIVLAERIEGHQSALFWKGREIGSTSSLQQCLFPDWP